jgi:hypothetical protein
MVNILLANAAFSLRKIANIAQRKVNEEKGAED